MFAFFEFLYPKTASGKEETMEEVVEKLYRLENMNHSDSGKAYFYRNQQYIDYVAQMSADYVGYCLKLHPEIPYGKYQKVKKRQKLLVNVLLGIQAVLAVVLFLALGILGLLISIGIFIGYIVWQCKGTWRKPYAKLVPEEMDRLLHENDYHLGTLSLMEYKFKIDSMREQVQKMPENGQGRRYCVKCGKPLEGTWKDCPYCGNGEKP